MLHMLLKAESGDQHYFQISDGGLGGDVVFTTSSLVVSSCFVQQEVQQKLLQEELQNRALNIPAVTR